MIINRKSLLDTVELSTAANPSLMRVVSRNGKLMFVSSRNALETEAYIPYEGERVSMTVNGSIFARALRCMAGEEVGLSLHKGQLCLDDGDSHVRISPVSGTPAPLHSQKEAYKLDVSDFTGMVRAVSHGADRNGGDAASSVCIGLYEKGIIVYTLSSHFVSIRKSSDEINLSLRPKKTFVVCGAELIAACRLMAKYSPEVSVSGDGGCLILSDAFHKAVVSLFAGEAKDFHGFLQASAGETVTEVCVPKKEFLSAISLAELFPNDTDKRDKSWIGLSFENGRMSVSAVGCQTFGHASASVPVLSAGNMRDDLSVTLSSKVLVPSVDSLASSSICLEITGGRSPVRIHDEKELSFEAVPPIDPRVAQNAMQAMQSTAGSKCA